MSIRIPGLLAVVLTAACAGQQDSRGSGQDSAIPDSPAAGSDAASGGTMPSLFDITWNLVELDGQAAPTGMGGRPATLLLDRAEQRASGFAGCNRMGGSFTHSADSISFGPLAMTRMACTEGMELEQRYAAALEKVTTLRLTAAGLELLSDGATVARFSAVPPEE